MPKKIYVSPSDQTANTYAAGNTTEAVQCRKIAKSLVSALERCGFSAKTNVTDGMQARVTESNAWGANLHICVHTNAYNNKTSGTRLFCYALNGEGEKACKAIMATLAPITPGTSDGITARPELYETRATNCPCVYVEVDFHDVDEVALWIIDHTEEIAEAIAKGVCNYYGVKYINDGKEAESVNRYKTVDDVPESLRAETQELVDLGALRGNENGLDVTDDMLRTMIISLRATKSLLK
ncbi:MAG: N-acetylmuramoyl-L-alanine amidase [Eubacteriales bacterium]